MVLGAPTAGAAGVARVVAAAELEHRRPILALRRESALNRNHNDDDGLVL